MYMKGDNYPPGTPAPREFYINLRCGNKECVNYDQIWEVLFLDELGGTFCLEEDKLFCEGCDKEAEEYLEFIPKRSHH